MNKTLITHLREVGPIYASLHELLGSILGDWHLADNLLDKYPSLPELAAAHDTDLQAFRGMGPLLTIRLRSALELGRRMSIATPGERAFVRSPADAARLLMGEMGMLEQEELRIIILDTRNGIIAQHTVYKGSLNQTILRPADVYREPIRRNAAAIIALHNHPSGNPTPSPEDVSVTRDLIKTGELLDISLLDHLIIGNQRFVSLKERGLAFS